jgi:uncharacterized cupin superfamily protein
MLKRDRTCLLPDRGKFFGGKGSIVIEATASADLKSAPISRDWILDGRPEARNKTLAESHDRTSRTVVWECTAGRFHWHYSEDETVVVISGEVFITSEDGEERRLGQQRGRNSHQR